MTKEQKNATSFCEELVLTMDKLAVLMEKETALLPEQDIEGLKKIHESKSKLVLNHSAGIKEIKLNPALLRDVSPDMRAALKARGEKLAEVSQKNALALKGAIMGTKKLMHHVIDIVKKEKTLTPNYANPKSFKSMRLATTSPCSPVACNRTV